MPVNPLAWAEQIAIQEENARRQNIPSDINPGNIGALLSRSVAGLPPVELIIKAQFPKARQRGSSITQR